MELTVQPIHFECRSGTEFEHFDFGLRGMRNYFNAQVKVICAIAGCNNALCVKDS